MSQNKSHTNFMNGKSYFLNDSFKELEFVLLSSFLNEQPYYNGTDEIDINIGQIEKLKKYLIFPDNLFKSRQKIFIDCVNKCLNKNFKKTLELIVKARNEYFIRNAPTQIIVIASTHKKRVEFNKQNPKFFREVIKKICLTPPDMKKIITNWKKLNNNSISKLPSFIKRAFVDIIENLNKYKINKYRKDVIDIVRISHPKNNKEVLKELMSTGKLQLENKDIKWETHKSLGKDWIKTLQDMNWKMPHMAALRNIRSFAKEVRDENYIKKYCDMLESGVKFGKQLPFRYLSAYEAINEDKIFNGHYHSKKIRKCDKEIINKCLENCLQISIENHPKLEGDVFVLSDNSGSAWGTCTSQYGKRTVAEIGNLSGLITALSCTGRGVIGLFGDKLLEYTVDKNKTLLENYEEIKKLSGEYGTNVGGATENGIWLFFKRSFQCFYKYKYDHLFVYSDMQAGHGELYGIEDGELNNWMWDNDDKDKKTPYIDVLQLLCEYRKKINPELNTFMIQTAGYNDSILPENIYRGAIFSGWTGNEVIYANEMIKLWEKK